MKNLPLLFLAVLIANAETASPETAAPSSPSLTATAQWFSLKLQGRDAVSPAPKTLAAEEVRPAFDSLWAAYKEAAISLGWDKQISEAAKLPTAAELRAAPRGRPPRITLPPPAVIPCGDEKMPYFLLAKGERPEAGWPLFFQTHGGGSTDEKLSGPHGWPVNTMDWKNQIQVCAQALPDGMYFVPRMANDNKGRWWFKHNHIAFDRLIRRAILFRNVDPNRIYMMGISEGAYGTEALTPFWADRFAGGCAMAGGAGGGERFYNLRNTAFRNDTGEGDTMFDRKRLAEEAHAYLAKLKAADPGGYDHMLLIHKGMGHGIDYRKGPAWISRRTRNPSPAKICWFNFALDGERRSEFSWLSLAARPERDTLIIAEADRETNTVRVAARINPPEVPGENPVYNTKTPDPVGNRVSYHGNTLTLHLNDTLVDLDKPVTVEVNGEKRFTGPVERTLLNMAEDIARHGDPGRVFPSRIAIKL